MKNNSVNTKSIVESAILSVLIVLVTAASIYVPFFELIGVLIVPIIVSLLYIRHDLKFGILSVVVSFILIFLICDISSAFTFITMNVLPGMTLGYCVKNKKSGFSTIFFTAIACSISIIMFFYLTSFFIPGMNITTLLDSAVKTYNEKMKFIMNSYKQMGISEEKISLVQKNMPKLTKELIMYTFPGYIIVVSMIFSLLDYKMASIILKRLNIKIPELKEFKNWHVNDIVAAVVIGLMAIGVIMKSKNIYGGDYILYTSNIVGKFIFIIVGISLIVYLLSNKYGKSKSKIFLIIFLTFLFNFGNLYFILGITDSIFNLRKFSDNFHGNKLSK